MLDIPGPPDSYDTVHQKNIYEHLNRIVHEKLVENREKPRNIHGSTDDSDVVSISVKSDGTYKKRYGLKYEYLVGDGDSKSFLDVWNIYGV